LNWAVLIIKEKMDEIEFNKDLEKIIGKIIDDKLSSKGSGMNLGFGISRVLQGLILAGIIGLFINFNELKEATSISKTERENFKEDIKELKEDIRSLRNALYGGQNTNPYQKGFEE
jgi:hypothetical protein